MECLYTQKGQVNFYFYLPNQNGNGEDGAPDGSDSSPIENKSQVQVLVLLPCTILYCPACSTVYILLG